VDRSDLEAAKVGTAFWALLDRWKTVDRFSNSENSTPMDGPTDRLEMLHQIARLCAELYPGDAEGWLTRPNGNPAFGGLSPLAHMSRMGQRGAEDVLHHLRRMAQVLAGGDPE
jgi:Protein of unknown function (DUF2384)